jgi:hypothetical protein
MPNDALDCPECFHPNWQHTLEGCQDCTCQRTRGTKGDPRDDCPYCHWMNKYYCRVFGCPKWIVQARKRLRLALLMSGGTATRTCARCGYGYKTSCTA